MDQSSDRVRHLIRQRYARAAYLLLDRESGTVAAKPVLLETGPNFGSALYSRKELRALPPAAIAASLGCGSPTAHVVLQRGQKVLDLGCGGGIDVLLAARSIGPQGISVGLDMTAQMLRLAGAGAQEAEMGNVRLVRAAMERLPFPNNSFDIVMSNSTINLSTDKRQVLGEAERVLKPGGALMVIDVLADDGLTSAERLERSAETGCTVGALSGSEYIKVLAELGFRDISVEPQHAVADRMAAGVISACKQLEPDDFQCAMMST